jgi:DNA helicase-2/ATP-dependent DNA helicase PcrA
VRYWFGVRAMRERLLSIIGPEAYYTGICTFHSFCSDVLKSNPDSFVLAEDLEPLSDLERIQVFREIIDEGNYKNIKPFGSRYYYVRSLIKTIQDLKREGISHSEFLDYVKSLDLEEKELAKLTEVSDVYKKYDKARN